MNRLPDPREIDPVQDLLFKPRTVFRICEDEYERRGTDHDDYAVEVVEGAVDVRDLDPGAGSFLGSRLGRGTLARRLQRPDCTLYLAREDATDDVVGYYCGVVATDEPVWHDSYRVAPGDALVFNAWVDESHRRRGIYGLLQAAAHDHLLSLPDCECVVTIVEDRNTPSMEANSRFGLRPAAKNYLLKAFGINILSIVRDGETDVGLVLTKGGLLGRLTGNRNALP